MENGLSIPGVIPDPLEAQRAHPYRTVDLVDGSKCVILRKPTAADIVAAANVLPPGGWMNQMAAVVALAAQLCEIDGIPMPYELMVNRLAPLDVYVLMPILMGASQLPSQPPSPDSSISVSGGVNLQK